jgi:stearoyl-CoA desaturase (delta-9 desaturase)
MAISTGSKSRPKISHNNTDRPMPEKLAVLFIVVVPLVATVYALYLLWGRHFTGLDLTLMFVFYLISGLGVTVGFHRMLTHKSFETTKFVKALFIIMGSMSWEGSPIIWASTHIRHHAHSDEEDDPHSPLVSLWHAHVGWMFQDAADTETYGKWLRKDPTVVWADKYWVLWGLLGMLLPTLISGFVWFAGGDSFLTGAFYGLLWGGFVRIFITHHVTWSVNSICHTFGKRPYQTTDESRNNWLVGLLAFGEGWHNNHHAFPRSAFHGMEWWQFDLSSIIIATLEKLGIVWKVHRVSDEDKQKRLARAARNGA